MIFGRDTSLAGCGTIALHCATIDYRHFGVALITLPLVRSIYFVVVRVLFLRKTTHGATLFGHVPHA